MSPIEIALHVRLGLFSSRLPNSRVTLTRKSFPAVSIYFAQISFEPPAKRATDSIHRQIHPREEEEEEDCWHSHSPSAAAAAAAVATPSIDRAGFATGPARARRPPLPLPPPESFRGWGKLSGLLAEGVWAEFRGTGHCLPRLRNRMNA